MSVSHRVQRRRLLRRRQRLDNGHHVVDLGERNAVPAGQRHRDVRLADAGRAADKCDCPGRSIDVSAHADDVRRSPQTRPLALSAALVDAARPSRRQFARSAGTGLPDRRISARTGRVPARFGRPRTRPGAAATTNAIGDPDARNNTNGAVIRKATITVTCFAISPGDRDAIRSLPSVIAVRGRPLVNVRIAVARSGWLLTGSGAGSICHGRDQPPPLLVTASGVVRRRRAGPRSCC